jgi:FkbM family methyltransferase
VNSGLQRALLGLYRRAARGSLMRSRAGQLAFEAAYLTYKGLFEARAANALRAHVHPGTTVIDVGANIGFFTTRFARWASEEGRVLAIEPEAANLHSLKRRLARHPQGARVTVIEGVAEEKTGTSKLVRNPDHPGDHKLGPEGEPVRGWTLDDLVSAHECPPVSLIKIDVQGAELKVLRGAAGLLERDRPVLFVEIDPAALASMGDSVMALDAYLSALGYAGRLWPEARGASVAEAAADERIFGKAGYVDALYTAASEPGQTGSE